MPVINFKYDELYKQLGKTLDNDELITKYIYNLNAKKVVER